ncbi:MAG: hypothetical protein LBD17_01605, partial [Endomicrobium sp.]|nr:hypothetical protein [Endomicrobium sp.]
MEKRGTIVTNEYTLNGKGLDINIEYTERNYPIEIKIKDNIESMLKAKKQLLGYMNSLEAT